MYKSKKNMKYKFVIILVLVILVIFIFSLTLKRDRQLNKFESFIKDAVLGIENTICYPFRFVIRKVDNFSSLIDIRKKYDLLKSEVDRIDSLNAENVELRRQLAELKKELTIENVLTDYEYMNATVISRNVGTWYNIITIDKGSYNGVRTDMAVVNSNGLIGKVISTTTFTSDIRLLTTGETNNKISITVTDGKNFVNGLIKGYNYKSGYLEVEGISNTDYVGSDALVYTSGLGGVFPSGILIGTVKNITTDEYDLAKIIDVVPAVNFEDINYVAILKRKEIVK